ncbi:glycosyltransferase family 2 protein [bacterium]|nr:MAG: glycosyltransferase family 2 protein [bacterium]
MRSRKSTPYFGGYPPLALAAPHLTVVIPAYNEEERLPRTLERIVEYYSAQTYSWEVIVVSDGSKDGTGEIVRNAADPRVKLIEYQPNRGKGFAVRTGMLAAEGDLVLFCDADLATPQEETEKLLPHMAQGARVAIGSRPLEKSNLEIRQPWYRELAGRGFNTLIQILAIRGIEDTQCGFKMFDREATQEIFSRCKLDGFGFDFEALMIARDLGYRIDEVPIRWRHMEGSKVSLLRDGMRMLRDLLKLRSMGKRGRLKVRP